MAVIGLAAAVGGCASTGTVAPTAVSLPEATPAPAPVNYGTFLGGPAGARLPDVDRAAALAAETGAVESGQRRSWKGAKGVFGYVEPGPATPSASAEGAAAECRSFTSTIFFAGRPQTGHGTGCRGADGTWHLTS